MMFHQHTDYACLFIRNKKQTIGQMEHEAHKHKSFEIFFLPSARDVNEIHFCSIFINNQTEFNILEEIIWQVFSDEKNNNTKTNLIQCQGNEENGKVS